MSDLSTAEVEHLAKLARLELSSQEVETFSKELPKIVGFVETLQELSVPSEETASDSSVSLDQLREDRVGSEGLSLEQLERLAPEFERNHIVVPPVFGESNDV